jgi:hypothetical protein
MQATEIWVDRQDYRKTQVVHRDMGDMGDGEIRVAIDKFALTSNNVGYALSGDMIGYWNYFPAQDNWGKVTVWGMADVVESRCPDIPVGERLYGFFPMASHLDLQPGQISAGSFIDAAAHRAELPGLYNQYTRTASEPDYLAQIENERCVLFPLFMTGFVLNDYLEDNNYFGAEQVLIGSVSSKTGFGLANFLHKDERFSGQVVGLTSAGNKDFVESLGVCDQVVIYGDEDQVDAGKPSVLVDMSGDGNLVTTLHEHLQNNMVQSIGVGATHWDAKRSREELPGAQPAFFFAPAHIAKRDADWGPGVLFGKANAGGAELAQAISGLLSIEVIDNVDDACQVWRDMLDNNIPAKRGIMISLSQLR